MRAFAAWQAVAQPQAGPLFRRISTGDDRGDRTAPGRGAPHPRPPRLAGLAVEAGERLSAHALRVDFITAAYAKGVRDEDIMRHTRHRDLRSMRGYVRLAGLLDL